MILHSERRTLWDGFNLDGVWHWWCCSLKATVSICCWQLRYMQENNVIKASKFPWSSPVNIIQKKGGSVRFCIDFCELNSVTKPLPKSYDLLDHLGKVKYSRYSTLYQDFGHPVHPDACLNLSWRQYSQLQRATWILSDALVWECPVC